MQAINPTRASSTVRRTNSDDIVRTYRMTNYKMREIKNSRDNKLPYINGEADGLSFSSYGKMTPSLEVVFEEINRTHSCMRTQTHLDDWAEQGVLLLNSVLTTKMGKSKVHHGWGWEIFIWGVLRVIYDKLDQPMVFLLWGKDAQNIIRDFKPKKDSYRYYPWRILKACHPQAQNYNPSNKFVGCNHFIEANLFLMKHDKWPVWWPDPKYLEDEYIYTTYCDQLLKQIPDAKIDFLKKLQGSPSISNKSHPFDDRLGQDYSQDLPF